MLTYETCSCLIYFMFFMSVLVDVWLCYYLLIVWCSIVHIVVICGNKYTKLLIYNETCLQGTPQYPNKNCPHMTGVPLSQVKIWWRYGQVIRPQKICVSDHPTDSPFFATKSYFIEDHIEKNEVNRTTLRKIMRFWRQNLFKIGAKKENFLIFLREISLWGQ